MRRAVSFCILTLTFFQCLGPAQSPKPNGVSSSIVVGLQSKAIRDGLTNRPVPSQRFVCNSGYTQEQCHEEMLILRNALAVYPLTQLGDWTWVLVRSQDWKAIVASRGLDPDSPAFTFTPRRETFLEEALVAPVPVREKVLLMKWKMSRENLLDFAIRHELGHAICNDPNEKHADHIAELLAQNKEITCEASVRATEKTRWNQ